MNAKKREPGHAEISTGRWAVVVFRAYEDIMVMFNCCVVIRGCKQLFLKCRPTMVPFSIRVFPQSLSPSICCFSSASHKLFFSPGIEFVFSDVVYLLFLSVVTNVYLIIFILGIVHVHDLLRRCCSHC